MKKIVNGVIIEMTSEEIAEMEKAQAEIPEPEPTPEERLAAVESSNAEILEALEMILSGVTE